MALLSAAGVWAAFRLPSGIYPRLDFQRVVIVAKGTALGAEQIEYAVTRPIEEAVSVVPGVERVRSRSIRGGAELSVLFSPSTDMVVALQLVQAQVGRIVPDLPQGMELEVERMLPSLFPILTYSLEGGEPAELYDIARYQIAPVLTRIPGVGRVDVQGSDVREIEIIPAPDRLATLGMGYTEFAAAVRQGLGIAAVGRLTEDYRNYLLVVDELARSVDDVGNVVVKGVRLGDLAQVVPGIEDRVRLIYGDGRPAALINISRQPEGNTVMIADSVAAVMRSLESTLSLPAGARLVPAYDQASLVRGAVHSVRDAMIVGAILVVIVLLVFLREGRITAIAAASIPLTMAITILALRLFGQSFNLMSLGGMAIAIGLVIDDAVVVTENIARHLTITPGHRAIPEAMAELVTPVTTSTLTTIVVFLPLGLLEGVVGQFFAALSIALATAVLISLVLAFTLVPLLCDDLLAARVERERRAPASPKGIASLTERYGRSLEKVIDRPRGVVVIGLAMIAAGLLVSRCVGTGFLPVIDEEAFVFDYVMPGGTPLEETDRELKIVERILDSTPEVAATARRTGSEMGLFATGQNTGDIAVRLTPRRDRSRTVFEVIENVRSAVETEVPRMRIEFVQVLTDLINDLAGTPDPLEIKLFGDRLDEMESYARRVAARIEPIEGVVDLYEGVSELDPVMGLHVDRATAERAGLTSGEIAAQVQSTLLGESVGEVQSESRVIGVRVRAPDSIRFDPLRVASLPVFPSGSRSPVPLSALARFERGNARAELLRENQREMVAVTAGIEGRSLGDVIADVKRALATEAPPRGTLIEIGGQYEGQQEAFHSLVIVLLLAVMAVVAVMLAEFRSFVEPAVIVLAAPLSFVGAMALLWVTGTQLDVSSFMGMILLVGLIVKNGILLIDFTNRRMRDGSTLRQALPEAARTRVRPILMTTLATLFGLLPLAFGVGAGSELQRPLALAVIGGLALSTPVTLYLVPAIMVAIRGPDYVLPRGPASS